MIEVSHISKKYGDHYALKDLSFRTKRCGVYGLLGANGAGKTTTLSILTGCLAPDTGKVSIDGSDILLAPREAKGKLGYLPELPPLYPEMTPLEYLSFVCRAKGIAKERQDEEIKKVIEHPATALKPMLHRLIKNLSKGYKQRVGLAAALLGEPEVLVLDEPTVGLDPKQIIEIRELVKSYGKEHLVLISSHILSEIDRLCDRVLILSHGELVAQNTPEALSKSAEKNTTLHLTVKAEPSAAEKALFELRSTADVLVEPQEKGLCSVTLSYELREDLREKVFFCFCREGLPILEMNQQTASLEDVFLELSGEKTEKAKEGGADE